MKTIKSFIKNSPWVIAVIYIILGFLWILLSDRFVLSIISDPELITTVQSKKGWFFVFVSGVLIFFLISVSNEIIGKAIDDLSESNKKFKATFDGAPIGIAHHGAGEKWLDVNQTMCNLLGYSKNELLKTGFSNFIHPDDIERSRELDKKLENGEINHFITEKKYIRKDGTVFHGLVHKSAVFNQNGEFLYFVVVLEDISLLKEHEENIKKSLKEKELLLSEVHHRVKNNLALVYALFDLEIIYTENKDVQQVLQKNLFRIKSLSLTHETFSDNDKNALISFDSLSQDLISYFRYEQDLIQPFDLSADLEPVHLNINIAIPVSLVLTEIFINANIRNSNTSTNSVQMIMQEKGTQVTIKITEPKNGSLLNSSLSSPKTLSHIIIQTLISQVQGSFSINKNGSNKICEIVFQNKEIRGSGTGNLASVYSKDHTHE